MNLKQSFCGKGVRGKMTIVICHNCHFLVEKMSGHPCGAQGDWSPVRLFVILGHQSSKEFFQFQHKEFGKRDILQDIEMLVADVRSGLPSSSRRPTRQRPRGCHLLCRFLGIVV